jgi:hypothetical protein
MTAKNPTIVIDLSGGVVHVAYATEPVNVIVISHDKEDILEDDERRGTRAPDGNAVAVWGSSVVIDPDVIEHYTKESLKE